MSLGDFLLFLFLGFIVFRVTRFLLKDSLIEKQRIWTLKKVAKVTADADGNPTVAAWRMKILQLLQCTWCLSVWVALFTELAVWHWCSIRLPALYFIALSGVSLVITDMVEDG